jgi:hypothetical protein
VAPIVRDAFIPASFYLPLVVAASLLVSCSDSTRPTRETGATGFTAWELERPISGGSVTALWGQDGVVFAVGDDGMILRYDGQQWRVESSPTTNSLGDVWGSGATDVYAVGGEGTIVHFDGAVWETVSAPTGGNRLTAVWGNSASNVYAVGFNGTIVHFDGESWQPIDTGGTAPYLSVWVNEFGAVYAGSDSVTEFDGESWRRTALPGITLVTAIWGTSFGNVFAGGEGVDNKAIYHFNWYDWSLSYEAPFASTRAIVGTGPTEVYAVGDFGDHGAAHFDGVRWQPLPGRVRGEAACVDGSDLLVGDWQGGVIRYDGAQALYEPGLAAVQLNGVWAWSGEAFAVGNAGTILRNQGGGWEHMESGTHSDLLEVWGLPPHDVFAVGNDGTILEYDGVTWHGMDSPTSNDLTDVWGWTGDDVFAVTGIGQTLHYDGDTWSVRTAPLLSPLTSLWGVSASEVYAAGDHRDLIRYNGSEWVVAAGPGGDKFSDIWGVGSSFIVVAEPKTFGGGVGLGPEGSIHLYDGNDWRVWARRNGVHFYGASALHRNRVGAPLRWARMDANGRCHRSQAARDMGDVLRRRMERGRRWVHRADAPVSLGRVRFCGKGRKR